MSEPSISWDRLNRTRVALGVGGVLAGVLLGGIFVVVWHWVVIVVAVMFNARYFGWVYLLDVLFVLLLLWEGRRYKGRMPPPSPFTNEQAILVKAAFGTAPFTPEQAAFGVSEILYVAPRLFFWGTRHFTHIVRPSPELAESAAKTREMLRLNGSWVPFDALATQARSPEEAAAALALLVRAGLAEARCRDNTVSAHVADPAWI